MAGPLVVLRFFFLKEEEVERGQERGQRLDVFLAIDPFDLSPFERRISEQNTHDQDPGLPKELPQFRSSARTVEKARRRGGRGGRGVRSKCRDSGNGDDADRRRALADVVAGAPSATAAGQGRAQRRRRSGYRQRRLHAGKSSSSDPKLERKAGRGNAFFVSFQNLCSSFLFILQQTL